MFVYGIKPPLADPIKDPVVDPVTKDAQRYQTQCRAALSPQLEVAPDVNVSTEAPEFAPEFLAACEE